VRHTSPAVDARRVDQSAATLDVHGLAPGTRALWVRGFLVEHASAADVPCRLTAWTAPAGVGTPLLWSRDEHVVWAYLGTHHPRTVAADALSPEWVRRVLREPALVDELPGVFAFLAHDQRTGALVVAADRLGVQGVYWTDRAGGGWTFSSHLLWLLDAVGHDGAVDDGAFVEHMGFGYTIDPRTVVYRGVRRLGAGSHLRADRDGIRETRHWSPPNVGDVPPHATSPAWLDGLAESVHRASRSAMTGERMVVGMTAGKDSLCLASALASCETPVAGTFGVDGCADRVQGQRLGTYLGWPSTTWSVCAAEEFEAWAVHVAEHSAGLATASYVDMAAFVGTKVPPGSAFVMGEGGECVRDFFLRGEQAPLETLRRDYTTPEDYLRRTLAPRYAQTIRGVGHALVRDARTSLGDGGAMTDEEFAIRFYRRTRMPGNFAARNALLGVLRPKLSPFLDNAFIDGSYGVSAGWHACSRLHRELIARARVDLLPYFDAPLRTTTTTQEWPARFGGATGQVVYALLDGSLGWCDDVLDAGGVRALCRETMERPSRAIYHLLRVLSFTLARRALREAAPAWRDRSEWVAL
jgi:hypothetical protein